MTKKNELTGKEIIQTQTLILMYERARLSADIQQEQIYSKFNTDTSEVQRMNGTPACSTHIRATRIIQSTTGDAKNVESITGDEARSSTF